MKEEFIKKWSNWWVFNPNKKELNKAFEVELNNLINEQIKTLSKRNSQQSDKHTSKK